MELILGNKYLITDVDHNVVKSANSTIYIINDIYAICSSKSTNINLSSVLGCMCVCKYKFFPFLHNLHLLIRIL